LKLPRRVVAVDYGEKGDLYIRFKHVDNPQGEPTTDGRVLFFFEESVRRKSPVAVEILDVESVTK
jgi:hypothetical protein